MRTPDHKFVTRVHLEDSGLTVVEHESWDAMVVALAASSGMGLQSARAWIDDVDVTTALIEEVRRRWG